MTYGYARVSTKGQERDGNGLEAQIKALRERGAETIYQEAFTGTKKDRPQLNALMDIMENGDKLLVCKLDRIARSTQDGLEIVKTLLDRGCSIEILNMGLIDGSAVGKVIMTVFFAFATFERDLIVQRTQEGKAIAKLSPDFREGRPPKFSKQQRDHALTLLESGNSLREVSEMTGISKSTLSRLKREKKAKEIQTA